ncbi:acetate kinase [Candidatus Woesearchaeota archaeon]|nr:acetate kinase [Candidatus Woesearchaeota archaeon]
MRILVLNSGSSSLKYKLFDTKRGVALLSGHVDAIGLPRCNVTFTAGANKQTTTCAVKDHLAAVKLALQSLLDFTVIARLADIDAVGHRVVHGGEYYTGPTRVTKRVLATIKRLAEFAPLHNPPEIAGIKACMRALPSVPQVIVCDTAFHQTIPDHAFLYGIPYGLYKKYRIRKYGFHGTSHKYVAREAARMLGKEKSHEIITCHLGNGSSICAVKDGRSVDTSMGFSPLDGLIMGTRSGELDPEVVLYLIKKKHMDPDELSGYLNKQSGLKGISNLSSDVRDLKEAAAKGNAHARLALDMLAYRIAQYVGSYMTIMHGLDAIVFTAGIGENEPDIRRKVCGYLAFAGLTLDPAKNRRNERVITRPGSRIKALVIPTNEELEIAKETEGLLRERRQGRKKR